MRGQRLAHTRILTVNLPRLMSGVLTAIVAEHQEMEIVGEADACNVLEAVRARNSNVVVIGTDEGRSDPMFALLETQMPTLRIVTIDREGRRAIAYEPGAAPLEATEVSPGVLMEMLRGTTR